MKKYSTLILADKRKIDKSILQNYEVNKHLKNYREVIQQIIQNKFGVIVSKEAIVNIVKRLSAELDKIGDQLEGAIESLNTVAKKPYEVIESKGSLCYQLTTKDKVFLIPVSEIDAMFKDFSSKGNNLSGEEMRQKYKLKPEAWDAIKSKLKLYKASHVVSPYTLENLSEEEEEAIVDTAISDHLDTKGNKFVKSYEKQFKARANKAIATLENFKYQLAMIEEAIQGHRPLQVNYTPKKQENNDSAHYFISDIHIGKLDTQGIIQRLDEIHGNILSDPESICNFTIGGDLVETLAVGGMHQGQLEYGTDPTVGYGFDLMIKVAYIFERFFESLAKNGKKVHVRGITGNHGRTTQAKADDPQRTGELVIYELIKRGLQNTSVEIEYFRETVNSFVIDSIEYLLFHGDGETGNQSPEKLIIGKAKTSLYTVLLTGDKHSIKILEGNGYTFVRTPALAGPGRYDIDNNYGSETGYIKFVKNSKNTVDFTLKRLGR